MKYLICLILMIILSLSTLAQTKDANEIQATYNYAKVVIVYANEYNMKAIRMPEVKTIYKYDENGNELLVESYSKDIYSQNSTWRASGRIENKYDSKNNLLSKSKLYFNNNNWLVYDSTNLQYDNKNNLIFETNFKYDSGLLESKKEFRYIYKYDTNDSLSIITKEYYYNYPSEQKWKLDNRKVIAYEKDSKNRIKSKLIDEYYPGANEDFIRNKEIYTYNNTDNRIKTTYQKFVNGKFENIQELSLNIQNSQILSDTLTLWDELYDVYYIDEKTINKYDSKGNILENTIENWEKNSLLKTIRTTQTFNQTNKIKTKLITVLEYPSTKYVNYERYSYVYDNDDNQIESLYEKWSNNNWMNSEKYIRFYSWQNQLDSTQLRVWVKNNWRLNLSWINNYNNEGYLVKVFCVKGDSSNIYNQNYGLSFIDRNKRYSSYYGASVYLYYEDITSVNEDIQLTNKEEITNSKEIELIDLTGRIIDKYNNYEDFLNNYLQYSPPYLLKWRDEKGIYHFEKLK